MKGRSRKSKRAKLQGTPNVTGSAGSRDGPMPSPLPESIPLDLFGQPLYPVNPSRRPASGKVKPTKDTSGPCSFGSSATVALQSSLVSKLLQTMDVDGSLEYEMKWTKRAMQSGPSIYRLAARARRISDSDCSGELSGWPTTKESDGVNGIRTSEGAIAEFERKGTGADLPTVANLAGWPSPKAQEDGRTLEQYEAGRQRGYESRKGKTSGGPASKQGGLAIAAQLAGWTTPRATDIGRNRSDEAIARAKENGGAASLEDQAQLSGWGTPSARDGKDAGPAFEADSSIVPVESRLARQATLAGWATPTVGDSKNACNETATRHVMPPTGIHPGQTLVDQVSLAGWQTPKANEKVRSDEFMDGREPNAEEALAFGPGMISSRAGTEKSGVLNPAFSAWLMALPSDWLMVAPVKSRGRKSCVESATE